MAQDGLGFIGFFILKWNSMWSKGEEWKEWDLSICIRKQCEAYLKCCNEIRAGILIISLFELQGKHLQQQMNHSQKLNQSFRMITHECLAVHLNN